MNSQMDKMGPKGKLINREGERLPECKCGQVGRWLRCWWCVIIVVVADWGDSGCGSGGDDKTTVVVEMVVQNYGYSSSGYDRSVYSCVKWCGL